MVPTEDRTCGLCGAGIPGGAESHVCCACGARFCAGCFRSDVDPGLFRDLSELSEKMARLIGLLRKATQQESPSLAREGDAARADEPEQSAQHGVAGEPPRCPKCGAEGTFEGQPTP